MAIVSQSDRAAAFAALHRIGAGFVLPNAWDAGTARILEQVGFGAIATTSAGIAWSRGVRDSGLARAEMVECIGRIADAVDCPVTADLESGYADTAAGVAETIAEVARLGVVGANLEDQPGDGVLFDLGEAVERIAAAREAAPSGSFVLNARTDAYMSRVPDAFAESVRRGRRFLEAGADCVFVPGMTDPAEIGRLVDELGAPVNMVAGLAGEAHDAATLRALGVARISTGGGLTRAALTLVERAGREMLDDGTFGFTEDLISYPDIQSRFA
jgi:2-methylisocitrate lyase-like PEP mutase family enzyme